MSRHILIIGHSLVQRLDDWLHRASGKRHCIDNRSVVLDGVGGRKIADITRRYRSEEIDRRFRELFQLPSTIDMP
jgi:serine/threonine protein phosphatase PrpC